MVKNNLLSKPIMLLFFALGFFSLTVQTVAAREFMISFGGSELGLGLFYFFWFFWAAVGAGLAFSKVKKFLNRFFFGLLLIYPLLALAQVFLFLNLRYLAGVQSWELFPVEKVLGCLALICAVFSLLTGMIFTLANLRLKESDPVQKDFRVISKSYIWESIGSFIAGAVITIMIAGFLKPLTIIFLAGTIFYFVLLVYAGSRRAKPAVFLSLIMIVFCAWFLIAPSWLGYFWQAGRIKAVSPDGKFVAERYTPYRHILLSQVSSSLVVFDDGQAVEVLGQASDADRISALSMAQSGMGKDVLVIGSASENLVDSFLKFPIKSLTYCVEDRAYYDFLKPFFPAKLKNGLTDPRLSVAYQPAREFLKSCGKKYDLIIVNTAAPSSLMNNRFYTEDFYKLAESVLKPYGCLGAKISGGENYLGKETSAYAAGVYQALKKVFLKIAIMPGDENWFFVSNNQNQVSEDPSILEKRIENNIPAGFSFSPLSFKSLMPIDRVEFTRKAYEKNDIFLKPNTDSDPSAFLLSILVYLRSTDPYFIPFLEGLFQSGLIIFLLTLLVFLSARLIFSFRQVKSAKASLLFNSKCFQFMAGFIGFSFNLLLLFIFQNRFGTLFQFIGLCGALFMIGLCLGAVLARKLVSRNPAVTASGLIAKTLLLSAVLIVLTYPVLVLFKCPDWQALGLFGIFFILSGSITGASYPLSGYVFENSHLLLAQSAGRLEILDYCGAGLAGLLAGILFLPILGLWKNLVLLALLCLALAGLFVFEPVRAERETKKDVKTFPFIGLSYVLFSLCLVFLSGSFILNSYRDFSQQIKPSAGSLNINGCSWDENLSARICGSGKDMEYVLESKNLAPQVKGFNGPIDLQIKIDPDGNIKSIEVLQQQETSEYVSNLPGFIRQFISKSAFSDLEIGKNIDAISGATITSRAVLDTVKATAAKFKEKLNGRPAAAVLKPKIIFDRPAIWLIIFTVAGLGIYLIPGYTLARKVYLLLVTAVLGFAFNLTFSYLHLSKLLGLKVFSFAGLSHILVCLIPVILGLFLGQFWCGWLCPFGALQELVSLRFLRQNISPKLDRTARYFKYVFLSLVVLVFAVTGSVNVFGNEPLSIFFFNPLSLSWQKGLAFLSLFFSLFYLRFWCRYFCASGAFLSLFNRIGIFKNRNRQGCCISAGSCRDLDCIECNQCSVARNTGVKNKDQLFKIIFIFTLLVMAGTFGYNFKSLPVKSGAAAEVKASAMKYESVDTGRLKKMIDQGGLSGKEASYYKEMQN